MNMDLLKTNTIQKALKTFILIFIGTMALTISAKLKIPFYPVPMTMQTFVENKIVSIFLTKEILMTVSLSLYLQALSIKLVKISINLFLSPEIL